MLRDAAHAEGCRAHGTGPCTPLPRRMHAGHALDAAFTEHFRAATPEPPPLAVNVWLLSWLDLRAAPFLACSARGPFPGLIYVWLLFRLAGPLHTFHTHTQASLITHIPAIQFLVPASHALVQKVRSLLAVSWGCQRGGPPKQRGQRWMPLVCLCRRSKRRTRCSSRSMRPPPRS